MNPYEIRDGNILISTDPVLLDREMMHRFLTERTYWAGDLSREVMDRSLENSVCFGVFVNGKQAGFARVVTDHATFAWLADVFILEEHRGQGLSKKLVAAILAHPGLQGLRRFMLATLDAHGLYEQFGFRRVDPPERFMEIPKPFPYNRNIGSRSGVKI